MDRIRAILYSIPVVVIGLSVLFYITDGLSAFTTEGARRLAIEKNPVTLPKIELIDSDGSRIYFQDYGNKILLVDFIFTNCRSVCPMVTQKFKELNEKINHTSIKDSVLFVTISFDPDKDTPAFLKAYSSALDINPRRWKFVTISNKDELKLLLNTFGIIVIPASDGQYEHNSAIHLVDQTTRLAKIYDYDAVELILKDLENRIDET